MMLKIAGAILLAGGLVLLPGCGPKTAPPTPTVNESMTKVMAPNAQVIWDITSAAFNDKGDGLDPTKISTADWGRLEQAGQLMKDRARLLATAPHVATADAGAAIMGGYAAPPGSTKTTWDAASAQQIQALIDADPKQFASHAKTLEQAMDDLVKAARAKDAPTVYRVSAGLDDACDGCHKPFWGTDEPPPFPAKPAQAR
jgi:hypothetical protein